jgi:hypothetical protein
MKNLQSLLVGLGALLLGAIAALLLSLGGTSGVAPYAIFSKCKVDTGLPNKTIELQAISTTQDRAIFVSTDDKYRIDFRVNVPPPAPSPSPSPFPDDWIEIDLHHPKIEIMKGKYRTCTDCYFPFTFFDETTNTLCPDPGVHITR